MKNNTILGSALVLIVLLATPSYSAISKREVVIKNSESLRLNLNAAKLAQRAKKNAERKDFDNNVKITSVSQFKDVQPTDEYFLALQSLTERYGVVVAYKDGNFHAEIPLSRGQFAMFLDRGLDVIGQLATGATDGKYKDAFKPFSTNKLKLKFVSKIKDLDPKSPYYAPVKSLVERYGINFVDADGKFRPEQPITEKELQDWLDGVFSIGKKSTTKNVNRGQFVMKFNDTLDIINIRIADWIDSNK